MSASEFDLLVVGEGLSGIIAAAAAATQGLRVMLVSPGPGTFVLGTTCVDLDGLSSCNMGLAEHSAEQMEQAIAFFMELTASSGCGFKGNRGARRFVPTVLGTFQQASLTPNSLWNGDPRFATRIAVASIENLTGFDAAFVAERLSFHSREMGLDNSYRSTVIQLPDGKKRAWTTIDIATRVEREPFFCAALVSALQKVKDDAELLIIPGVLGMNSGDREIRQFETDIGCAICELATVPPNVPGLRLLQRLERRLTELGVELCSGFSVRQLCLEGDRCTGVILDTPGRPRHIPADSVVLACGRFSRLLPGCFGKGQRVEMNRARQPVNGHGTPLAENLFLCGSIAGSFESQHGNAVAIITGYRAAMLASERGVHYAGR
ncbi:MAG: FAD-binding protein [Candidatus Korobacteraceae bacterium]